MLEVNMEKRILLVGCNTESAGGWVHRYPPCWAQTNWLESITHVPKALSERNDYLLIIIFSEDQSYLPYLPAIRARTNTAILIVTCRYDGPEKTAAIQAGADEYMQRPETPEEGLASVQALIRRFTAFNRWDTPGYPYAHMGLYLD